MSNSKNKERPMFRELRMDAATDQGDRTVELSFSSEAPYERWFGTEILSHDAGAIDLSRLQEIGVLLFNHDSAAPIGAVKSCELDENNHRCKATVRFDEDELSETIYQKVISGTLKGVSVGYIVGVWEEVENGETSTNGRFAGPCSVATKWTPYEISIVSVPADASVGVGRSMKNEGDEEMGDNKNNTRTATQTVTPPAPAPAPVVEPVQTPQEAARAAVEEERQRVNEITSMCRSFGIEPDKYVGEGTTVEQTRAAVLDELAKSHHPQHITMGADESDKFRAAAADGLALRAGMSIEKPAEGAQEFRGKRMLRLAADCIERATGKSTRDYSDEELVRAALTGTGAFPGILSNVANKSMAQAYQTAPTTFQLWCGKGSNSDFKEATRYRLSEADELVKLTEQGEFKHSEISEASVTASLATYGREFSITRKAIINDDLGALSTIPSKYGAAARRMINKMVYKILKTNPTIEKAALFDAKHGNLVAGALSVESLGKAKAAMARQKNVGGKEFLNIQPAFLIVPVELEVAAAQLISSAVDPTKANATPNPFANKLSVVSEPELTDVAPWYLAAAAGVCPTVEVTYLNGNESPTMESAVQFDTLGVKWRIYLDVGVNLIDFRGLLKSSGANA